MNVDLSAEAIEYGEVARRAFEAAGGQTLVETAEEKPHERAALVEPVLAELGAPDLDPRRDPDELEAAAALCRAAGYWAVPYPVAEWLARPRDVEVDGVVVGAAAAVGWLDRRWASVELDGTRSLATPRPTSESPRATAFVVDLDLTPLDDAGAGDVALAFALPCWTLLGMLDRAIDLARAHVVDREQFGQPLAAFQSVQFQLTDAEVERSGVDILAKYALWSVQDDRAEAVDDALALRLAALEAAEVVFHVAHQLHGATGFCDETALSWVSRHSQPVRRLPFGLSTTRDALTRRIGRHGLAGLFA